MCRRRRGLVMSRYYGSGSGKIWLYYTHCSGSEESLVYCSPGHWGDVYRYHNSHYYDVSIYCRPGLFTTVYTVAYIHRVTVT